MVDPVTELLDEFIVRYRRGEDPDLRDYLARAGERADELGLLVEGVLRAVPPPEPSEESVALARAWVAGQPPLLELRVERGLTREAVVDLLREGLGLAPERREKLRLRYHQLETGQLEPAPVDKRVWQALADALRVRVEELRSWARPVAQLEAQPMFRRESSASYVAIPEQQEPPDEVDRLFGL